MHRMIVLLFFFSWVLEAKAIADEYRGKDRLARSSRRRARDSEFSETKRREQKSPQKDSYLNFLPFGGGQFLQKKNYMGTALAATQAGSLLLYFDRMQQVRTANDDAAAVMNNNQDPNAASTFQFLDQNEKYVLQSQKESRLFLISFIGLYTFGVVDAVFDPLASYGIGGKKKKKSPSSDRPRRRDIDADFDDEPGFTQDETTESQIKISFLVWENQQQHQYKYQPVYGLSLRAEL